MKKKKTKKLTKAEQLLERQWAQIEKSLDALPKFSGKFVSAKPPKVEPADLIFTLHKESPVREGSLQFKSLKSRNTGGGSTSKPDPLVYSGDKIVGLATMHKSNLVPVFSNEEAEDVAKMRRS